MAGHSDEDQKEQSGQHNKKDQAHPTQGAQREHHDHELKHQPLPEEQREITAILILGSNPLAAWFLPNQINEGSVAQAVLPIREISNLFAVVVEPIELVLLALSVLTVVVSGIGILVSIYNSMNDRRREIAVMRALGARRQTVLTVILLESILLSLGGGVAGWVLGHGLIGVLGPAISAQTGVSIGFLHFVNLELALIPGLIVLASLVGYLPAMAAYRTDVAKSLSATP